MSITEVPVDLSRHTIWLEPRVEQSLDGPEQALAAFAQGMYSGPSLSPLDFGSQSQGLWFLSSVKNLSLETDFVLSFNFQSLDQIDLWIVTAQGLKSYPTQGDHFVASRRYFDSSRANFKMSLATGQSTLILYRILSKLNLRAGTRLDDFQSFSRREFRETIITSGIYGALLIMAVYHLFLWFSMQHRIYLIYSLFSISGVLVSMNIQGQLFQYLFPANPEWSDSSVMIGAISVILLIEFSIGFLEMQKYSPRSRSWLRASQLILVATSLCYPLMGSMLYTKIVMLFTLPIPFFLLVVSIFIMRNGLKAARYYIFGSVALLSSIVVYVMSNFDLLPFNQYVSLSIPIGNLIQKAILAMALGDKQKIYREQAENEAAARQSEDFKHKAQIEELNASLETKVEVQIHDIRSMLDRITKVDASLTEAQSISSIGSWELDLRTQEMTCSAEYYRIFELDSSLAAQELIKIYRNRIAPEDLVAMDQAIENAKVKNESFQCEQKLIFETDRVKHALTLGQVITDSQGQVIGLSGTTQDITSRKLVELKLLESEQILRFALEGAGDGVWHWNIRQGKLQYSIRWKAMLGYADSDIGQSLEEWTKRIHPDDIEQVLANLEIHHQAKNFFHSEYRVLCKDGRYKWILGRGMITSRSPEGDPLIMIGTHADISRIKLAEAQALQSSKLASLGEMSAGIAHEVCNPLAIISAVVRILPKFFGDYEKLMERISMIEKAIERINRIVNGLRKYSRSSNAPDYRPHSLSSIVDEALILTAARSTQHGTVIHRDIKQELWINCDEVEIEQVLVNLINNGIDASKDSEIKWLQIQVYEEENTIVLRVIDSGPGIDEAIRTKIFDPFFTTKMVNEGTGLGLSISKGILDHHQAQFSLLAAVPNTCFEIRFNKFDNLQIA